MLPLPTYCLPWVLAYPLVRWIHSFLLAESWLWNVPLIHTLCGLRQGSFFGGSLRPFWCVGDFSPESNSSHCNAAFSSFPLPSLNAYTCTIHNPIAQPMFARLSEGIQSFFQKATQPLITPSKFTCAPTYSSSFDHNCYSILQCSTQTEWFFQQLRVPLNLMPLFSLLLVSALSSSPSFKQKSEIFLQSERSRGSSRDPEIPVLIHTRREPKALK